MNQTRVTDRSEAQFEPAESVSLEPEDELQAELRRVGLQGDLFAMVLKREVSEVISFGASVVLIPLTFVDVLINSESLNSEVLSLALRQTIDILQPHGPNILLAETMLSLARSSQGFESGETLLRLILEAIKMLQELHAMRRLTRAYTDLGMVLKNAGMYVDALRAFELAADACAAASDPGALAATYYHQAHICRLLQLELEALVLLTKAEATLPDTAAAEKWRKQILTERVHNNLMLRRDDAVLDDVDKWIASGDRHFFPYFRRAEVWERKRLLNRALDDYCEASIELAQEILRFRSARFRSASVQRYEDVFDRSISCALECARFDLALGLLAIANSGGRVMRPVLTTHAVATDEVRSRAAEITNRARQALDSGDTETLRACHDDADGLLAEHELFTIGDQAQLNTNVEVLACTIMGQLPAGTALIEITVAAGSVWIVTATANNVQAHKTELITSDMLSLKASFRYECEGLFPPTSLEFLGTRLLKPVDEVIRQNQTIILSVTALFYGIPFHAIPWRGAPLLETHNVRYATSVRNRFSPEESGKQLLSLDCTSLAVPSVSYGHLPELKGVRREVEMVKQFFDDERFLSLPADSSDLLAYNARAKILHIACHGEYDEAAPLLTRLLLRDRPVFAFEIALAKLEVETTVMTACETAEGIMHPGGYTHSLVSAFLDSGVKTVVGSLWPVDDSAGSLFANEFFAALVDGSLTSPSDAVIAAQRAVLRDPRFRHPYFWASFAAFERK